MSDDDTAVRLAGLMMRAGAADITVLTPRSSGSGLYEARGKGWTVTDPDRTVFADQLEARLDERDRQAGLTGNKAVRQWQYEQGERRLPEAPWTGGNWSLAGLVYRLVKRRNDRLRDARQRMSGERG